MMGTVVKLVERMVETVHVREGIMVVVVMIGMIPVVAQSRISLSYNLIF